MKQWIQVQATCLDRCGDNRLFYTWINAEKHLESELHRRVEEKGWCLIEFNIINIKTESVTPRFSGML